MFGHFGWRNQSRLALNRGQTPVVIYIRCDGQEAISASGITGVWGN